ncbi:MAG TPA: N-acetylmuramic acid 6-phosphate etherase, partial [Gaiellaceae bacterium]
LIDEVAERLTAGGRLIYVGAGTSGRLAALDAAECEPTFSIEPGQVIALVAGADLRSSEEQDAAEDDQEAGAQDVRDIAAGELDAVIALSASGRTPYVLGAVRAASAAGALTAAIVSTPDSELARLADHEISLVVGPEFIAGSTRLKAGTAQKLVLNTISTVSMIRLGKTYGDLMVDVSGTNDKLRARARRIVLQATGASPEEVDATLAAARGSAKVAIVSLLAGIDVGAARSRLDEAGGSIREAIGT